MELMGNGAPLNQKFEEISLNVGNKHNGNDFFVSSEDFTLIFILSPLSGPAVSKKKKQQPQKPPSSLSLYL